MDRHSFRTEVLELGGFCVITVIQHVSKKEKKKKEFILGRLDGENASFQLWLSLYRETVSCPTPGTGAKQQLHSWQ